MLYLNERDIKRSVSLKDVMEGVEKAFHIYKDKNFFMPDRIHIDKEPNTLLYMPCFTKDIFGTKIISLFPENTHKNLPVIDGLVLLNNIETGKPVGMLNGAYLTAYRTGAVGGVGVKYVTPEDVTSLGLIGTGVQGFYQVLFACEARDFKKVTVYNRTKEKVEGFIARLKKELPNMEIVSADTTEELVKNSEVIITATSSNEPVLPDDEELLKGKHIVGIGSYKPDMHEFPKSLYGLIDNIYIDNDFACEESGDLITPLNEGWIEKEQVKLFTELMDRKVEKGETTLFKSVGMALFDMVVSQIIYEKAKEKNIGQKIEL
ncbi:ornithine cyclodeaminase family protein [Anaeromicrobium sediminis]|uniref:Ornithine cyclodeaminase n=1 Tax=Anaeromicrobium sediminis TaxID=1478221 RepID=A0A267MPQ0_9FIRM|nr:ornithine cyclodeaminase family protein [Anaeromicrobium sediminis]PAB60710.1 hypothetical protein CCE28_04000 [Anaeromicrobium sediminis]